jgi:hypothetical protein
LLRLPSRSPVQAEVPAARLAKVPGSVAEGAPVAELGDDDADDAISLIEHAFVYNLPWRPFEFVRRPTRLLGIHST